jgi:deazaflavin-dependent oxidoreductase (nitroreductase family)
MSNTQDWNRQVIEEFRANEGRVGGPFEGIPLLLLHTKGARSGSERVNPVAYQRLGPRSVAVFASKGGAASNPDWYYNLVADPETKVEIGDKTLAVHARVADEVERGPIWEKQKIDNPGFAEYELKTTRKIPVVILEEL